jgi:hypothetical protein
MTLGPAAIYRHQCNQTIPFYVPYLRWVVASGDLPLRLPMPRPVPLNARVILRVYDSEQNREHVVIKTAVLRADIGEKTGFWDWMAGP